MGGLRLPMPVLVDVQIDDAGVAVLAQPAPRLRVGDAGVAKNRPASKTDGGVSHSSRDGTHPVRNKHLIPAQRLPLCEALPYRRKDFRIGPDLRMAGHAGMGRRDAGILRHFDRRMAVTAIEAEPTDVVLMAERHRCGGI